MATMRLASPRVDEFDLDKCAREILNRRPAVGLALGLVSDGTFTFAGHGLADIESGTPMTADTIFRIASVTKTFTAIAVMQLCERGVVELDAPANHYLRAFRLVPADRRFRPATVRHLLTHTAGIREALHLTDLMRIRDMGTTMPSNRPVPSLAQLYRGELRFDAEPGTRFMYTNHGFAVLGQIVEDVTGQRLERYFQERIFGPLGMVDTSLDREVLDATRFATPYELGRTGPRAVRDYEVITYAAGGVSSTPRDLARYLRALLRNDGAIVQRATLREMFQPQFQPDPRIPGMGLAFFRGTLGTHRFVDHGGVLPGFDSEVLVAPDDGWAVMAFANGARRGMLWLAPEVATIARQLTGAPEERLRTDVPHHPELWPHLRGYYHFSAALTDPAKLALGPGVEVVVRGGRLIIRALSPIPALLRGFVLHPDDPADPYVFRIKLPWFGLGTCRVVFSGKPGERAGAVHVESAQISFQRRAPLRNPRPWVAGALALLAAGATVKALRR